MSVVGDDHGNWAVEIACSRPFFPPRHLCPFCWSEKTSWTDSRGVGTVYSFTVIHRPPAPEFAGRGPYIVALVDLVEGPRVMANIVGHDAMETANRRSCYGLLRKTHARLESAAVRAERFVSAAHASSGVQVASSLRNRTAIVGIGESDIGKVPHLSGLGLTAQAAKRALDESGLALPDIDGLLTAYSLTEPFFMMGTVLCEYLGLKPRFCSSLVAGGATPAILLGHAAAAIIAGQASCVLVCTGENRATGMSRDSAVSSLASAVGHPYVWELDPRLLRDDHAPLHARVRHYARAARTSASDHAAARRPAPELAKLRMTARERRLPSYYECATGISGERLDIVEHLKRTS